jgi:hypothetical protein
VQRGTATARAGVVVTCRWPANAIVRPETGGPCHLAPSPVTERVNVAYEELIEAECVAAEKLAVRRGSPRTSLRHLTVEAELANERAARDVTTLRPQEQDPRLLSGSVCGETAGQGWSRLGESNPGGPRPASPGLYQRQQPHLASTGDNSCRSRTFGCTNGTVRPGFAPRSIPRRASARAQMILVYEEGRVSPRGCPVRPRIGARWCGVRH